MKWLWVSLAMVLLVGCALSGRLPNSDREDITVPPVEAAPSAPREGVPSATQPPVDSPIADYPGWTDSETFTMGPDRKVDARFSPYVEIHVDRPVDTQAVAPYVEAPGQVRWRGPNMMVVELSDPPVEQEHVVIRAGAPGADGRRLAQDWTVTIQRSLAPAAEREEVPGGFRVGPFSQIRLITWDGNNHLFALFQEGRWDRVGQVKLTGSGVEWVLERADRSYYLVAPVLGGRALLESDQGVWLHPLGGEAQKVAGGWQWHISPDGTRVVTYPRCGAGTFVDLRTRQSHPLDAPEGCGGNVLDSWSPDGSRYLVQAQRANATPGFYFFDGAGEPVGTFHQPGHLVLYGRWSPDSSHVAFLSVPLDVKYPNHLEAFFDPPIAPRVGVLDLASGQKRWFALPDQVAGSPPLWSPDGRRLAVTFGQLAPPREEGGITLTQLQETRAYVVDVATGTLKPVTEPAGEIVVTPDSWSPDGSALLVTLRPPGGMEQYALAPLSATDAEMVPLPGKATWLTGDLLITTDDPGRKRKLLLFSRQGEQLRTLADGFGVGDPVLSPDGEHVAFAVDTWAGARRMPQDPPATYLVVLKVAELVH